jgi:diguanylate cyclase (GGDEF)-like protein
MKNRLLILSETPLLKLKRLPGYTIVSAKWSEALVIVNEQTFDVVLIAQLPKKPASQIEDLRRSIADRNVPIIGTPQVIQKASTLLTNQLVLGVVDLLWDPKILASALSNYVTLLQNATQTQHTQLMEDAIRYHDLIFKDDLTQLSNKRSFDKIVYKEHERCARFHTPYALVFLDLDNLKQVNVKYGHLLGGDVLAKIAQTITSYTRKCDFAFRFGGDEFVVLLVNTDKRGAKDYAERLCKGIRELHIAINNEYVQLTASAGVASFPEDGMTYEEILTKADRAMYAAKHRGKDRVILFDDEVATHLAR